MKGYLTDYSGKEYLLPVLLRWEVKHSMGLPADSFEIECLYDKSMLEPMRSAVKFRAVHDGTAVFCGLVDDFELSLTEKGLRAVISGRGMAARLLDNEAEAAEYGKCGIENILAQYVRPFGIADIRCDKLPELSGYTVQSGDSCWNALQKFTHCAGGITPYFTPSGRLMLTKEKGQSVAISEKNGIISASYRKMRYGVVSEVLVKNRVRGTNTTVKNAPFIATGGSARRVVNVPRTSGYDAMRYTGSYQIENSEKGKEMLILEINEPFQVFPADVVEAHVSKLGISGKYTVSETRSWADGAGSGSEIKLIKG